MARRTQWPIWIVVVAIATTIAASAAAASFTTTVVAPDGTALATDVYLPIGAGPWPVVLTRTPYGKDGMAALCVPLNLYGFACVAQDTRGRFDSGGTDSVFRDDGPDGRATLAWIVEQGWCDGNVATWGGSATGITQYALAPGAGPALRSVMAAIATPDLYHHTAFQGGALREALLANWLAGQGSLYFLDEVREHRLWDGWWHEVDALAAPETITAAGLHVGGWYDIFGQGTLDAFVAYQHHGGPGAAGSQYLVMGPWTHDGIGFPVAGELSYPANATLDLEAITLDWLGFTLRGDDTGVETWPPVSVYLMGAVGEQDAPGNRWLELPDWPPATHPLELYLDGGGGLAVEQPPAGELQLTIDPADPVPTLGGANLFPELEVDGRAMGAGPYDQRTIEARDDGLTFSSSVLSVPLTVVGRISCRVWVRSDTPDLDLSVRLSDVYPDGRSMLVTDGIQRARMRCGDDRECLLEPGRPAELVVDLWSTAIVFNAGHRVRISVAGSNSPRFEVNPNDGGPIDLGTPIVAHPSILLGPETPSLLVLPVMPAPRSASGRRAPPDHDAGAVSRR